VSGHIFRSEGEADRFNSTQWRTGKGKVTGKREIVKASAIFPWTPTMRALHSTLLGFHQRPRRALAARNQLPGMTGP